MIYSQWYGATSTYYLYPYLELKKKKKCTTLEISQKKKNYTSLINLPNKMIYKNYSLLRPYVFGYMNTKLISTHEHRWGYKS